MLLRVEHRQVLLEDVDEADAHHLFQFRVLEREIAHKAEEVVRRLVGLRRWCAERYQVDAAVAGLALRRAGVGVGDLCKVDGEGRRLELDELPAIGIAGKLSGRLVHRRRRAVDHPARRSPDVLDNFLSRFLRWSGLLSHLRSCERYDEPETFPSSIRPFCPMSADGGHKDARYKNATEKNFSLLVEDNRSGQSSPGLLGA
jgi:hypothetical protein